MGHEPMSQQSRITLDGRTYRVRLHRRVTQPPDAPRLVVVSYLPNAMAPEILRVCLGSIQKYTVEPHELWVVDNNSPRKHSAWLLDWPGINLVLNLTEPLPREGRTFGSRFGFGPAQRHFGSYANAAGIEIALRLMDPVSRYVMTLHQDVMPCREGWLRFLMSKIAGNVKAAGVRMDTARTPGGVLHVLGCLVDYQRLRELGISYWPDLPALDVGDGVTIALRAAGHDVVACRNTLHEPELAETLPIDARLRGLAVDRSFDDDGRVIFLHLGRGVVKSEHAESQTKQGSAEAWIAFANAFLAGTRGKPGEAIRGA